MRIIKTIQPQRHIPQAANAKEHRRQYLQAPGVEFFIVIHASKTANIRPKRPDTGQTNPPLILRQG